MKILTALVLMFLASACLSGKVLDGLYAGAGGGVLHVGDLEFDRDSIYNYFPDIVLPDMAPTWVTRTTAKSKVAASSVLVGYNFLRYFAVEGRYTKFQTLNVDIEYNEYLPIMFFEPAGPYYYVTRQQYDLQAFSLALNMRLPIGRRLGVIWGVGGERMEVKEEDICALVTRDAPRRYQLPEVSSNQWIFSAGLDCRIWKGVSAKVSWTRHYYQNDKPLLFAIRNVRMDQYQLDLIYAF